MLKDKLTQIAV